MDALAFSQGIDPAPLKSLRMVDTKSEWRFTKLSQINKIVEFK
ncbi:hypothetical protein SAMN05421677_11158 [Halobacillus aidingensis]|uniref:Uncharacterized protein n=1 Tax=Halobacillus aidingensis TaxID=240303 RepID=A0A1H0PLN7_HALAD|nr:hypothetical protein SAMN05421677_11158 [Halobacillus aidingensis]